MAAAVLVPPMALSRILLGVHYPSDVAAGVALGAAVAAIAVRVDSALERGAE
jgi:membrane-associated phospholipid phosphatase